MSLCLSLFQRFLSNRGCCRYQTWICGYVQRALGTTRVWSGVVQEQHVYGGGRSVSLCLSLFPRFLSNRGCCRYQTLICGYVQRALGTARVWSGVVQEQHVYGGGLKLYTVIILGVHLLEIADRLHGMALHVQLRQKQRVSGK